MTIKPNYVMASAKTFAWIFVGVAVARCVVPYFQGKGFRVGDGLGMGAFAGVLFGIFVAVFFTPREITWDEETIKIRAVFPGSGDFTWRQLQAWNPYGCGTFLIKFEDKQAFQISPAGFRSKNWKASVHSFGSDFRKRRHWCGLELVQFVLEREMMPNTALEPTPTAP